MKLILKYIEMGLIRAMIPKIIVRQTSIAITNYTLGDCTTLENYFLYEDYMTNTLLSQGMYYDKDNSVLYIPRGLDISYIEYLFKSKAAYDNRVDPYSKFTGSVNATYLPKDDRQKETLRFILGIDEYEKIKYEPQASINLEPGAGKTYLAVMCVIITKLRAAMITSNSGWIKQWKDRILEYTDMSIDDMYFIEGYNSIDKIIKGKVNPEDYKFFLVSHKTIQAYGDRCGWDKVHELFKSMKIGIKIFDEAHTYFKNMYMIDFFTNTYKTYYLTATPTRSSKEEKIIYKLYFKNVAHIDLFDEENDPRTHYIAIHFKSNPTYQERKKTYNFKGFSIMNYINYLVYKKEYYQMLTILMDIIDRINGKVLIYIGINDAIFTTREWLISEYPELAPEIGVYTSMVDKKEKQEQLNKRIILSTTKSTGAAQDIKGLKAVIVLNEPFKSEVIARQTLGRTRDRGTYYFDIVDDSFRDTYKFYICKKKVFAKYALTYSDWDYTRNLEYSAEEAMENYKKRRKQLFYRMNDFM